MTRARTNHPGSRLPRADMAEMALALHAEGASKLEIAAILGISRSYAYELVHDPAGDKVAARRRSYQRPCPKCGGMMSGCNAHGPRAPKLCTDCAITERREMKVWTHEALIEAIRAFAAKYGRPPGAQDWNPPMARAKGRDDTADRFYVDACWPHAGIVQKEFGSWNAGIKAAGFRALKSGHKWGDSYQVFEEAS